MLRLFNADDTSIPIRYISIFAALHHSDFEKINCSASVWEMS